MPDITLLAASSMTVNRKTANNGRTPRLAMTRLGRSQGTSQGTNGLSLIMPR
jgi:hypothetical protein